MDHTVVESLVRTLSKLSTMTAKEVNIYSKTCVKWPLKNRQNKDLNVRTLSKLSTMTAKEVNIYSKTCVKLPLKNRQNKDLNDKW